MKFHSAHCICCYQDFYTEDSVVAFRSKKKGIETLKLDGREPWSGVKCVCKACVSLLADRAAAKEFIPDPPV